MQAINELNSLGYRLDSNGLINSNLYPFIVGIVQQLKNCDGISLVKLFVLVDEIRMQLWNAYGCNSNFSKSVFDSIAVVICYGLLLNIQENKINDSIKMVILKNQVNVSIMKYFGNC